MRTAVVIEDGATVVDLAPGVAAHIWPNAEIGIAHDCRVVGDVQIRCAPRLTTPGQPGGHQVVSLDPLTITPSVLCDDCGFHGFVTDGVWRCC